MVNMRSHEKEPFLDETFHGDRRHAEANYETFIQSS